MIAVADASPLNYLALIDEINLLPAVFQELQHPRSSPKVRQWVAHLPAWSEVRTVGSVADTSLTG
jgi:predicted nucleic acid-binding protein